MPGLYLLCALVMREYTAGAYNPNAGSSRSRLHTNQTDMRPSSNHSPSPGQTTRALYQSFKPGCLGTWPALMWPRKRVDSLARLL
jgi:hypothetical protein